MVCDGITGQVRQSLEYLPRFTQMDPLAEKYNYGHTVKFYIYVAATGAYTSYNSNSEYSGFHETNLLGAVVTAPKRK